MSDTDRVEIVRRSPSMRSGSALMRRVMPVNARIGGRCSAASDGVSAKTKAPRRAGAR